MKIQPAAGGWCGKCHKNDCGHRRRMKTPEERFWPKVDRIDPSGCWVWTAAKTGPGYGKLFIRKIDGRAVFVLAHRFAYELLVGPVPEGLVLDHLCRNRACCNPEHLEPVTHRENCIRGASPNMRVMAARFCKHGHEWTRENTYVAPSGRGGKRCRACHREHQRDRRDAS